MPFERLLAIQDLLRQNELIPFAMSGHCNLMDPERIPDFEKNIRLAAFFGVSISFPPSGRRIWPTGRGGRRRGGSPRRVADSDAGGKQPDSRAGNARARNMAREKAGAYCPQNRKRPREAELRYGKRDFYGGVNPCRI